MEILRQILGNRILWVGVLSWFIAQIFKTINNVIITGKFSIERMWGDGGMPSGHSATVSSVALACGLFEGFSSPVFAVAFILAIIVMHDAMNVRLQAGKQAALLNVMAETFEKVTGTDLPNDEKLKELLGHTPLQVIAGCMLGLIVASVCYLFLRGGT
ncbi:MAG: divergent PAP2 family protein [Saccharofermentans sp.]|nr:divergent PAP2 family protein [Saccharofermentans sp.]